MLGRLLAVGDARNPGFVRDRGSLIFSIVLPVALVIGLSFVFGGAERPLFKVGVLTNDLAAQSHPFLRERFVDFVEVTDEPTAIRNVARHQLDLLLDLEGEPRYWVNADSPKG